jgi:hypothetical protein
MMWLASGENTAEVILDLAAGTHSSSRISRCRTYSDRKASSLLLLDNIANR